MFIFQEVSARPLGLSSRVPQHSAAVGRPTVFLSLCPVFSLQSPEYGSLTKPELVIIVTYSFTTAFKQYDRIIFASHSFLQRQILKIFKKNNLLLIVNSNNHCDNLKLFYYLFCSFTFFGNIFGNNILVILNKHIF